MNLDISNLSPLAQKILQTYQLQKREKDLLLQTNFGNLNETDSSQPSVLPPWEQSLKKARSEVFNYKQSNEIIITNSVTNQSFNYYGTGEDMLPLSKMSDQETIVDKNHHSQVYNTQKTNNTFQMFDKSIVNSPPMDIEDDAVIIPDNIILKSSAKAILPFSFTEPTTVNLKRKNFEITNRKANTVTGANSIKNYFNVVKDFSGQHLNWQQQSKQNLFDKTLMDIPEGVIVTKMPNSINVEKGINTSNTSIRIQEKLSDFKFKQRSNNRNNMNNKETEEITRDSNSIINEADLSLNDADDEWFNLLNLDCVENDKYTINNNEIEDVVRKRALDIGDEDVATKKYKISGFVEYIKVDFGAIDEIDDEAIKENEEIEVINEIDDEVQYMATSRNSRQNIKENEESKAINEIDDELQYITTSRNIKRNEEIKPIDVINDVVEYKTSSCRKNIKKISSGKNKKKLPSKFQAPVKSKEVISKTYYVTKLDDSNITELIDNFKITPIEICLTILYREGHCQLTKLLSAEENEKVKSLMIMIVWDPEEDKNENLEYFYELSLNKNYWQDWNLPKELILKIFNLRCRKIAYESQKLFLSLLKKFKYSRQEVCLEWIVLDPLVACYLLQPDKPLRQFIDVLKYFNQCKDFPILKSCDSVQIASHFLTELSRTAETMYNKLKQAQLWKLFLNMESKIIALLAVMEFHGILSSKRELEVYSNILHKKLKSVEKRTWEIAGKEFQINSPLQVRNILYFDLKLDTKLGVKIKETAAMKEKSTSEPMLRLLLEVHPLPGLILHYRHIYKAKYTYIDAMIDKLNNDVINCSWNQTIGATGRITSSDPNLQNIPKIPFQLELFSKKKDDTLEPLMLRSVFKPRPEHTFVAADYQHLELRIFTHLSKCPKLLECFKKGDIFICLAEEWLGQSGIKVGPEEREKTKRIVYSVMYGAGPNKLSEYLQVTVTEANKIITNFLNIFPALRTFSQKILEQARKGDWPRTLAGRMRPLPEINSGDKVIRSRAERQCVNFVIQGSAADICKMAMINVEQLLQNDTILQDNTHLLVQIHDELVWEVKNEHLETVKDLIQRGMKNVYGLWDELSLPLPVTLSTGNDWGNMIPETGHERI